MTTGPYNKFKSRKFLALAIHGCVLVFLPILYKYLGIGEGIIITVLTSSSALVAAYTGFNVMQKKYDERPNWHEEI